MQPDAVEPIRRSRIAMEADVAETPTSDLEIGTTHVPRSNRPEGGRQGGIQEGPGGAEEGVHVVQRDHKGPEFRTWSGSGPKCQKWSGIGPELGTRSGFGFGIPL